MFFPQTQGRDFLIGGLLTFSIAYLSRPIGALLFGFISDKYNRVHSLSISLILMSVPTLIIGLLPTYDVIGSLASITVLLCRFFQGIFLGGEYNGSAIVVLNHYSKNKGLVGGILSASCISGALVATLFGALAQQSLNPELYFRLLYILGSLIAVAGFALRKFVFSRSQDTSLHVSDHSTQIPFFQIIKKYKKQSLIILSMGCVNGALSYAFLGFIKIYLLTFVKIEQSTVFYSSVVHMVVATFFSPLFGYLSDYIQNDRYIKLNLLILPILSFLAFYFLSNQDPPYFIFGQIIAGLMVASYIGPSFVYYQDILPNSVKGTGISLSCSIGMSLTAGLLPLGLITVVNTSNYLMSPAYIFSVLSLCVFFIIMILPKQILKE